MTKREKFPPLNLKQQEIVKKHEYRRWLQENGDPFHKAKFHFIQSHKMTEKQFDEYSDQLQQTHEFKRLIFSFRLQRFFDRWKKAIKEAREKRGFKENV